MKPSEIKKNNAIWWILGVLIVIGLGVLSAVSFEFRSIVRWFTMLISFSGVGVIFYSFAGIFTTNKIKKWLATIILIAICVFIFVKLQEGPKVIRMEEDVIYILPKAKR
jgi:hypothetical protein